MKFIFRTAFLERNDKSGADEHIVIMMEGDQGEYRNIQLPYKSFIENPVDTCETLVNSLLRQIGKETPISDHMMEAIINLNNESKRLEEKYK